MHYVTTWLFVTILLLVVSVITAVGAIRSRSVSRFIGAVALFIASVVCGGVTVLKAGWKVLGKVQQMVIAGHTGNELYVQLWGKPVDGCMQVISNDYELLKGNSTELFRLHFSTCPKELQRILAGEVFEQDEEAPANWPGLNKPAGKVTHIIYNIGGGACDMYILPDSTEAYFEYRK